jgi:tRNA pseudouridine38-40 synthase
MQANFKLTIEYDGSDFHGWQRQKTDRTIQGEIEKALAVMTRQKVSVIGSGRTDAGVHALGQVAHFQCSTGIEPQAFVRGLNSLLPTSIRILGCETADKAFHARYHAISKTYLYRIDNRPFQSAIGRQYAWALTRPLDLARLQQASRYLHGKHDFKAFEGSGSPRAHTRREVYWAHWSVRSNGRLVFEIQADGFLRYMVRNIVGTMIGVGLRRIEPAAFRNILASCNRKLAGITAPPQGLFLKRVDYAGLKRRVPTPSLIH